MSPKQRFFEKPATELLLLVLLVSPEVCIRKNGLTQVIRLFGVVNIIAYPVVLEVGEIFS